MPEVFGIRIDEIVFFGALIILAMYAIPAIAWLGVSMIADIYKDMAKSFKNED